MNWQQFISTVVVFLGVPSIIMYGIYEVRILAQRMPEQTALRLEQFARMAVQKVEQRYAMEGKTQKKMLAIQATEALFDAYKLPRPSDTAIDIAIESAVFLLPKE